MQVTINIPDDKKDGVIEAFASAYNYRETIGEDVKGEPIPNPQSKGQFAKGQVLKFIKNVFVANQSEGAETTRKQLIEVAEADMEGLTVE